jgi:hypothetical protein
MDDDRNPAVAVRHSFFVLLNVDRFAANVVDLIHVFFDRAVGCENVMRRSESFVCAFNHPSTDLVSLNFEKARRRAVRSAARNACVAVAVRRHVGFVAACTSGFAARVRGVHSIAQPRTCLCLS